MQTVLTCPESIVELYGVSSISIDDRSYFQTVFSNLVQPLSDSSFANNYIWANSFRMYWKQSFNHLCLFVIEDDFMQMFLPPSPAATATLDDLRAALLECFRIMNDYNMHHGNQFASTIQYVSDEMLERINACGIEGLIIAPSPMGKDYIYDMQKMITLSGTGLDSKRHARNKFMREYPDFYTQTLTPKDMPACIKLLHAWYNHKSVRGPDSRPMAKYEYFLDPEKIACEMTIAHWQSLDLKGMGLYAKGELIGFTYGEALSPTQASILIEKTHPDYYGASALIFSEFCRQYWSEYAECNVGDDGNSPNLRFTKQQYRPIKYLNKSIIMQARPL